MRAYWVITEHSMVEVKKKKKNKICHMKNVENCTQVKSDKHLFSALTLAEFNRVSLKKS